MKFALKHDRVACGFVAVYVPFRRTFVVRLGYYVFEVTRR